MLGKLSGQARGEKKLPGARLTMMYDVTPNRSQ